MMDGEVRIVTRQNCVLVFGSFRPELLTYVTETVPKGAVIDTDVAQLAGATLAAGATEDLAQLRADLAAERRAEINGPGYATLEGLSDGAREWLISGHQGLSSGAAFLHWTGVVPRALMEPEDRTSHPHDPADFNRLLLLLDAAPEFRDRLTELAALSPYWAALVARFDEIERTMLDEAGLDFSKARSAPRTYDLMQEILDGVVPASPGSAMP